MYQNNAAKFSAFAEENNKKAIFIKNETTKTLLKTVKTSILESEKHSPSGKTCLLRLCMNGTL